MEGLELVAFNIISSVGTARSSYIEASQKAKEGDFEGAEALIKEGDEVFVEGHNAHASLLQQEAEGGPGSTLSLLILHAEENDELTLEERAAVQQADLKRASL